MARSAEKLTWIEDVRALGPPARDLAALAGQRVALWGEEALSQTLYTAVAAAVGPNGSIVPPSPQLDNVRRTKSRSEQALRRRSAVLLAGAIERLSKELSDGKALLATLLDTERQVYAEDVRLAEGDALSFRLATADEGGGTFLVSALVVIRAVGPEVLWSAAPLQP